MSETAKKLLMTFASELDKGKPNSFDPLEYEGCSDAVISELNFNGFIVVNNNIAATIRLTRAGYNEAKR